LKITSYINVQTTLVFASQTNTYESGFCRLLDEGILLTWH
jgi:hypothetical protein